MIGHWPTMHPLQLKSLWIYPQNATLWIYPQIAGQLPRFPAIFFSGAGGGRVVAGRVGLLIE